MTDDQITRRKFVRDATAAAAGIAVGMSAACTPQEQVKRDEQAAIKKTRSYNENMEYRPLGKTGIWLSAVSMGGHWKKIEGAVPGLSTSKSWIEHNVKDPAFAKNRREVISACIDCGINYIDACCGSEVLTYAEALRGRRDKMFLGYSYYEHEMRQEDWQTTAKLLESLDDMMSQAKLEYVDLWRPTCYYQEKEKHTVAAEQAMVDAIAKAKKAGKVRFGGLSTHKHDWAIRMISTYPEHIQAVVVPYTAGSKKAHARVDPINGVWQGVEEKRDPDKVNIYSLIDAVKKYQAGWIGIKPFASGSVFKSQGAPNSATKQEDDERARLTLRHVLHNDALTATIPGLITPEQVHNAAKAVQERRKLDQAEVRKLQQTVDEMWANLPEDYQWLKDEWEYV